MILTGTEITNQVRCGFITISPFNLENVGPNSYNVTLNDHIYTYKSKYLDMKVEPKLSDPIVIPESGFELEPNTLYLGRTNEYTFTDRFIPMMEGRSSVGRLGVFVHVTAGFGDLGFKGYWTMEMMCIHPIVIYPNSAIAQLYFHQYYGAYNRQELYWGKYQNNNGVQGSKMFEDFLKIKRQKKEN